MRTSAFSRALSLLIALSLLLPLGEAFSVETALASHSQCSNGMDDDRDDKTDFPRDGECDSLDDDNEAPNEGVFVAVTDNRDSVSAGGALIYVITLKQQREPVKLVDVALHVPAQNSVVSVSDDGTLQDGGVRWRKVAVFNGNTRRLSVQVVVSPHAPKEHLLIARVLANGSEATDTTIVSGRPIPYVENQLHVSVTDHRDNAGPGDILDYVIVVRNPEPNGIVTPLRVKLPIALRLIDAPGADVVSDELIWRNVTLGPRDERVFAFRASVDSRVPNRYPIQVVARAGNIVGVDRTVTGGRPYSLFSSITDNRDSADRGDLLTYVIRIDNTSGRLDPHANIDAAIPQYSEFVSATEGGVRDRENIRWLDMVVAPNGSRDLEFTVRVRSDAPDGTLLRATAFVQGEVSSDVTQVTGGLSGYRSGGLYAGPLEVEKTSDRLSATAGSSLSYIVTVRNSNDREIRNIAVNDTFDPSEFTVTDPGAGDLQSGRIAWHIDSLQPGENRSFRYRGRLSRSLRPGYAVQNTARAFSAEVGYVPTVGSTVDVGYTSPYDDGSSSPYSSGEYRYDDYDYSSLPQTGIEDFFGPIENTRQFLTPLHAAAEGNAMPMLLWIVVIAAGLAGGAAVGRKFVG